MKMQKVPQVPDYGCEEPVVAGGKKKNQKMTAPTIYLDVPPDVVKDLKVKQKIQLALEGEVAGFEIRTSESKERAEIRLKLEAVGLVETGSIEDLADD